MIVEILGHEWMRLPNKNDEEIIRSPYLVSVPSSAGRLVLVRVEQNRETGKVERRPVSSLEVKTGEMKFDEYGVSIVEVPR